MRCPGNNPHQLRWLPDSLDIWRIRRALLRSCAFQALVRQNEHRYPGALFDYFECFHNRRKAVSSWPYKDLLPRRPGGLTKFYTVVGMFTDCTSPLEACLFGEVAFRQIQCLCCSLAKEYATFCLSYTVFAYARACYPVTVRCATKNCSYTSAGAASRKGGGQNPNNLATICCAQGISR